ncbi:hypothetical protein HDU88_004137 [Geranomyces variabilis]|nr:hypothetical protein HDU88_004137 [Geranomyces variabilis]
MSANGPTIPAPSPNLPLTSSDADVRVILDGVHFDVPMLLLKLQSGYFRAIADGPWDSVFLPANADDGRQLRQITPGNIITSEDFMLFLDYVYRDFHDPPRSFRITPATFFQAESVAATLYVPNLLTLCRDFTTQGPVYISWTNVEDMLRRATERTPRLESCRTHCERFLSAANGGQWVRVWYLAEQYELSPELTSDKHYHNLPAEPWRDPFFGKLSLTLQNALLLFILQNQYKPLVKAPICASGRDCEFLLGQFLLAT